MAAPRQRLDKWLWFARVVKSRTLAAKLVHDGHVRVNGEREVTAAKLVGLADVLTIALDRQVRILRVLGAGERRGSYPEACLLFEDLTPPPQSSPEDATPQREPGEGRPTKRHRRQLDRLMAH